MLKILLIFCSVLISFQSCKTNKDAPANADSTSSSASTPQTVPAADSGERTPEIRIDSVVNSERNSDSLKSDLYRIVVSFYSIGSGTENDLIRNFEDWIGVYAGEKNKTVDYEKSSWGREGETDFCLRLNELTPAEQSEFISRSKELLKSGKWVHVNENQPCKHKRKR